MPGLAAASVDMKDLQRCWMVKAVLGNVEPGGRLLEIGAGEPLVAGLLSRLGYEVTIVDPYDGSGNGPREYADFASAYPDLDFVRDQFPPGAARAALRLRLLDLGPRARPARGDRRGDRGARAACRRARRAPDPRGRPRARRLGRRLAPGRARADRRRPRARRRRARPAIEAMEATPRPTSSRPRRTTTGGGGPLRLLPDAADRLGPAARLSSERLGDPRRLAGEDRQPSTQTPTKITVAGIRRCDAAGRLGRVGRVGSMIQTRACSKITASGLTISGARRPSGATSIG